MRRALQALVLLLVISTSAAQQGGARISPCLGWGGAAPWAGICNVTAFHEWRAFGVFAQVTPRAGPVLDNWQVYAYRPNVLVQVGEQQVITWPGVAVGRQGGAWFAMVQADVLLSWDFSRPSETSSSAP